MCKLVFFSNYMNHHQKPLTDELYRLTKGDFIFVAVGKVSEWRKELGYSDMSNIPYVLNINDNLRNKIQALEIAKNADVALFGGADTIDFKIHRCKNNPRGLSFEVDERWFKKGLINLLSPRLLKWFWYYHTLFKKCNIYKLCSGAYTAKDMSLLFAFKNKCYKWGYFPQVNHFDIENVLKESGTHITKIMWCGRFIKWKHPELPILLCYKLRQKGYKITLDMYGIGNRLKKCISLANRLKVNDIISFCGSAKNDVVIQEMRKHSIFLFTSDRNEGWGAVANEAMSNGCTLVAADKIGSVPYLIEDGITGCIFKGSSPYKGLCNFWISYDTKALNSLLEKTEWVINNPNKKNNITAKAYHKIECIWSPENAAHNLLSLIDILKTGKPMTITEGPCSFAN